MEKFRTEFTCKCYSFRYGFLVFLLCVNGAYYVVSSYILSTKMRIYVSLIWRGKCSRIGYIDVGVSRIELSVTAGCMH